MDQDTRAAQSEDRHARTSLPRPGGRASVRTARTSLHDQDLDLLTAALLGVAAGVAVTLIIRRGPSGRSPLSAGFGAASSGVRRAGVATVAGAELARRGVTRRRRRGLASTVAHAVDLDGVGDQLREYLEAARGAVEDTVAGELRDLRRAVRRKRRRLGI